MRLPIAVLALAVFGCRPFDPGAPVDETPAGRSSVPAAVKTGGLRVGPLRVIDGDTFEIEGETVRIANIDAPESAPRAACMAEAALATVATRELGRLLGTDFEPGSGRTILPTLQREGTDRYGRTLARVQLVTGGDAGEEMVRRGVAVHWTGRQANWCGGAAPYISAFIPRHPG